MSRRECAYHRKHDGAGRSNGQTTLRGVGRFHLRSRLDCHWPIVRGFLDIEKTMTAPVRRLSLASILVASGSETQDDRDNGAREWDEVDPSLTSIRAISLSA